MSKSYVWYVTYGSNTLKERFMVYINGGKFRGKGKGTNNAPYRGCRDQTPPLADKPFLIPYEMYYGRESKLWNNGGIAFIDADRPGITLGRAYLITEEQFAEIQEQEGPIWYQRVVEIAKDADGTPYKTFTGASRYQGNAPSKNYTDIIFEGVCETYYPHLPYGRFHRLMGEAIKHLGKPYAPSRRDDGQGRGPDSFDCVWFVGWVFRESGVDDILKRYALPRLDNAFEKIGTTEIKLEGDVLFFCKPPSDEITHVGIYIGYNLMLHATRPIGHDTGSVRIDDITKGDWLDRLVAVGRNSV